MKTSCVIDAPMSLIEHRKRMLRQRPDVFTAALVSIRDRIAKAADDFMREVEGVRRSQAMAR